MDALLDGYESVRPLSPAEAFALPEILPVAHVEFALSEVEYFADVTGSAANAELAYDGYLFGHARWFAGPAGTAVLDHLRRRAGRNRSSPDFPIRPRLAGSRRGPRRPQRGAPGAGAR